MMRYTCLFSFFFFSSRRRHTRSDRDWSSDVCSSDLCVSHRCALQRTCGLDHAPRALHRKRAVSPDQKQDYPSLVPCLVARSSHFWDAETKLGDYSIPAGDRRAPAHGGRAARPTMRVLRWDRGGRKRSMTRKPFESSQSDTPTFGIVPFVLLKCRE